MTDKGTKSSSEGDDADIKDAKEALSGESVFNVKKLVSEWCEIGESVCDIKIGERVSGYDKDKFSEVFVFVFIRILPVEFKDYVHRQLKEWIYTKRLILKKILIS